MVDDKQDRRIQRTRQLLRSALVELMKEKGFDAITIQDVTDRANVGRTTFYLHYSSKEDLLLDHHAELQTQFQLTIMSYEQLFSDVPQPEMVTLLNLLAENRPMYYAISAAKDAEFILRGVKAQMAAHLIESLKVNLPDREPAIPLDVLAEYIVGARLSLIHWWVMNRNPYTALQLATILHQLQRAAIMDAYQMRQL
ncbi:MAG: TetR/AcrR family transcriptional regulator [Anaerolineae bacterium]|nr:TetR/AcrR family transcriptional regulator [Anaerolineae bacterium]